MGDEGIGVHVIRQLEAGPSSPGVQYIDGGSGGFHLLDAFLRARRVLMVDATADGAAAGTVRRLRPRYSSDYPRTLAAHDIGLKDLLDAAYLLGEELDVTLFAVSIRWPPETGTELSAELRAKIPAIVAKVREEAMRPTA